MIAPVIIADVQYAFRVLWKAIIASRLVLILIVLVLVLLNSGQGKELSVSLLISPAYNDWLLFLAVFGWACQNWLWSRVSIELALGQPRIVTPITRYAQFLIVQTLPVVFAVAAFLVAILQLIRADKFGLVVLIAACSLSLFVALGTWINNYQSEAKVSGIRAKPAQARRALLASKVLRTLLNLRGPESINIDWWWLAILAAYTWSIAWIVIGIANPLLVARGFGSVGIVLLALSALMPIAATAIIATRNTRFPILLALFLAPFVPPSGQTISRMARCDLCLLKQFGLL